MANLKIILVIVLLGLFTVLVMQNTEVVDVRFFAYEVSMSQIVLLLLTMLLGFVVGFITAKRTGRLRRVKRQARRAKHARNEEEPQASPEEPQALPETSSEISTPAPSERGDELVNRSVMIHGPVSSGDSTLRHRRSGPGRS